MGEGEIGDDIVRSSMDHGRYINFVLSDVRNPLFFLVNVNQIMSSNLIYYLKESF